MTLEHSVLDRYSKGQHPVRQSYVARSITILNYFAYYRRKLSIKIMVVVTLLVMSEKGMLCLIWDLVQARFVIWRPS